MDKQEKQTRYDELCAREDEEGERKLTDAEVTEKVQLFYGLNPESQYWRDTDPDLTPEDIWHAYGKQSM